MKRATQRGFTLVEMAIVLVIIGLILGAITIGKDVQRNAEYTKIKQKFIDQWVVAYNAHAQRTGVVVGDSQTAPQLMVNGANFTGVVAGGLSGGNMTTATTTHPAICNGAVGPAMTHAAQPAVGTNTFNLRTIMQQAGVRMPPGRAEGAEDKYVYLDSNGNPQSLQVCFQWNAPNDSAGSGNVMVITGLTPDLARALDQMIDGKADAREGMFRQQGVVGTVANAPGLEWTVNNQNSIAQNAVAAGTAGTNLDEDQIATVVGYFKMNQ